MAKSTVDNTSQRIKVLIADDSRVFRRFLRDIFKETPTVTFCGEANNGIEALDLILKSRPDVILMDMEMPLMDGMTALQHLMIHRPTPTIMFSSLTQEGTTRAFDALKNGAVDFFSKDLLFQEKNEELSAERVRCKVKSASGMRLDPVEPMFDLSKRIEEPEVISRVVFCEDCGARNIVEIDLYQDSDPVCSMCGDVLLMLDDQRYRRNSFISVICGGNDCYRNLLKIVPRLGSDLAGACMIVLDAPSEHVDSFTLYLDSISSLKVVRIKDGMSIEGGACYVASVDDQICLRPFSTRLTVKRLAKLDEGVGPMDMALASVASVFKKRSVAVLLSSSGLDGLRGLATVRKHEGQAILQNPRECLSPQLVLAAQKAFAETKVAADENDLIDQVKQMYLDAKSTSSAL